MEKIFYTEKDAFPSSERFLRRIFSEFYNLRNAEILRGENGKPFLNGTPVFFSVTHTKEFYFVAVSDENIGIDAEPLAREIDYIPILAKFSVEESIEILNKRDFFLHWTAKESVVKWLGGSLAADLKKISFLRRKIFYSGFELPVRLSHFEREGHLLALCRESEEGEPLFVRL